MELITIGGRQFKGAKDSTAEHDVFVQAQIEKAGLSRIQMLPGESPEDFALRIFRRAAGNSDIFLLLGGLMFPAEIAPADWTPRTAEETANFLRKLTGDEDKRIIRGQILAALMGFFQRGLAYGVTSPNSSTAETIQPGQGSAIEEQESLESGVR